jgi:hypothetical protein
MEPNQEALEHLRTFMQAVGLADRVRDPEAPPVLPVTIDPSASPAEFVDAFLAEAEHWVISPLRRPKTVKDLDTVKAMLKLAPEKQIAVLHEVLDRAATAPSGLFVSPAYSLLECAEVLVSRNLPYSEGDLVRMLQAHLRLSAGFALAAPLFQRILARVEQYVAVHGVTEEIAGLLRTEIDFVRRYVEHAEYERMRAHVEALLTPSTFGLPQPDEPWSKEMLDTLRGMIPPAFAAWQRALAHAARAEQSKPTAKWLREAAALVEQIGFDAFRFHVLAWFAALEAPARMPLSSAHGQLVKGLAWSCSAYDDPDLSRALGRLAEAMLKWLPAFPAMDWRCLKAGNACLYALSAMPGDEAVAQLSRLSLRLKGKQLQDSVEKALSAAVERRGMTRDDLEELTVPAHGLDADGVLRQTIGEMTAELAVTAGGALEWTWVTADGRRQKSPPAQLRQEHAGELKALKKTAEEISRSLQAQRARLERLLLSDRSWPLADWQARYCEHPLLAPILSRLIWQFEPPDDESLLGIPTSQEILGSDGRRLELLPDGTVVRLWHPLGSDPEVVRRWRRMLAERGIIQPFKQAHRELYLVSAEETAGGSASGRFAGHVIRQPQFKALCDERGWRYKIQGRWMPGEPRAVRTLAGWDLQVEFLVAPAGPDETNGAGALMFQFLTTGPVRFRRADGADVALAQVPTLVYSEVMRDLDLFVGVCSVGADPMWPLRLSAPHAGYWRDFAFGELAEAAAIRRDVLEDLLPGLSIAPRCRLDGRFLEVRGDLRTYRIHIGSGNVLMSPNDVSLCFAPTARPTAENVRLPFEGDTVLSLILSKATALADDRHISDRAIRAQIQAGV